MEIRNHIRRWTLLAASMLLLCTSAMLVIAASARADAGNASGDLPAAVTPAAADPTTGSATTSETTSTTVSTTGGEPTPPGSTTSGEPGPAGSTTGGELGSPGSSDQAPDATSEEGSVAGQSPTALQSNDATQAIGQVQTLGCTTHCSGTRQAQSGQQQNATAEVVPADAETPAAPAAPTTSTSTTKITQLQLGCVAHCFGTTTISADPHRAKQTIDQLLNDTAVPSLPTQNPVAADEENAVDQSAFQSQAGNGLGDPQSQSASQTNATAQTSTPVALPSAPGLPSPDQLTAPSGPAGSSPSTNAPAGTTAATVSSFSGLNSAMLSVLSSVAALFSTTVSDSPSPSDGPAPSDTASPSGDLASTDPAIPPSAPLTDVVNQVEQGIWQIQLGCLMFCVGTEQSQQATQSDTTLLISPTGSQSGGSGSATIDTYQLIWQLQIGCLFWCDDAIETQAASATATLITEPLLDAPPPSGTGGGTSATPAGQVVAPISGSAASAAPIGPPATSTVSSDPLPAGAFGGPVGRVVGLTLPPLRLEGSRPAARASGPSGAAVRAAARITSLLAIEPIAVANSTRSRSTTSTRSRRRRGPRLGTTHQQAAAPALPPNTAPDETALVLLGLAACIAALLAGDVAWRRHKLRSLT